MQNIKKIFGEFEMTWKRLIIFSIICGVYSAAVLMIPGVADTSLREIGVGYECWFILAIFVVSNCKGEKDAALKCFIFFLISQPLIYIVQSIFLQENLLYSYYKPWFIQTLFTLPGGAIAYQIKKDRWISTLILLVAGVFISFSGVAFFIGSFNPFRISYMIYGIFLILVSVILGFIFLKAKKKITYIILVLILGISIGTVSTKNILNEKKYEQQLSEEDWRVGNASLNNLNVNIEDDVLKITYYSKDSSGEITVINNKGEEVFYIIRVENGELILDKTF